MYIFKIYGNNTNQIKICSWATFKLNLDHKNMKHVENEV